jgi:hypothetical protein
VALVNNHQEIGGAGINTGTVPSKTLHETAREVTVADFLGHEGREIQLRGEKILIAIGSFPVIPTFFLSVRAKFTVPIRS